MRISDWSSDVCSSDLALAALSEQLVQSSERDWCALPEGGNGTPRKVFNPADHSDLVGTVIEVRPEAAALAVARAAASSWPQVPLDQRAAMLESTADVLQERMPQLMGVIIRERSEEHTSELQSLMRSSYAVFCLKKKNTNNAQRQTMSLKCECT